jgi:hypothetical protein
MMNKEYRLASWPELSPAHHLTAYRRMLGEMSQRYMSMAQLVESSGLRRPEVKHFLDTLEASGKLMAREACAVTAKAPRMGSLRLVGAWLRRAPLHAALRR